MEILNRRHVGIDFDDALEVGIKSSNRIPLAVYKRIELNLIPNTMGHL